MTLVYLAGPYTAPDPSMNTHNAIHAANRLMDAGVLVFIPHLCHLWHTVTPRPYEDWMRLDIEVLARCDALVRLPGESPGADQEESFAREAGIPCYYGVDQYLEAKVEILQ